MTERLRVAERVHVLEYSTPHIEDGVIKGVKIVGMKSANGRTYPRHVLRAAMSLYESAPVFILHPDARETKQGSRKLIDHFGSLQNIHERNGSKASFGLFADLHIKVTHPMADTIIKSIQEGCATFGLSHNVFIDMNEDRSQVLKITAVGSVDLVDNPATTTNLFEEENMATLKEQSAAGDKEQSAAGDDEFRAQVTEEIAAIDKVLETVQEELKEFRELHAELKEIQKDLGKRKKTRLTALENKTMEEIKEETGAPTIGNSHDDFLGALRGFQTPSIN